MLYVKHVLKVVVISTVNYGILWTGIFVDGYLHPWIKHQHPGWNQILDNPAHFLSIWYYGSCLWPKISMAVFGLIFGTIVALL